MLSNVLLNEKKREVPLVFGSLTQYETLGSQYGIKLYTLPYAVDVTVLKEIILGTRLVTPEEYAAIYSRLEFETSHSVSQNYLLVSELYVHPASVWMMRMTNTRAPIPPPKEIVKEVEMVEADVDKSATDTYVSSNVRAYVDTHYGKRVKDVYSILKVFTKAFGIEKILAPNDGAGVAFAACKELKIKCISSDPSSEMCVQALEKGNEVAHQPAHHILKEDGVIFISHSETLDPGVVAMCLHHKRNVIVYESVEMYAGYAVLHDNGNNVRSTYKIQLGLVLSSNPYPFKRYDWYDMTKFGNAFYVSDEKVVPHLKHLLVQQITPVISTYNYRVIEFALLHDIPIVSYSPKHVGVYLDKIDKMCMQYFSLKYGIMHEHPGVYTEFGNVTYVYGLTMLNKVQLGLHEFGVVTKRYFGMSSYGVREMLSSIHPRLTHLEETKAEWSVLEKLHLKCLGEGVPKKELSKEEKEVLTSQLFYENTNIVSRVMWKPLYRPPKWLRNTALARKTWQMGDNHFMVNNNYWELVPDGRVIFNGVEYSQEWLINYYKDPELIKPVYKRMLHEIALNSRPTKTGYRWNDMQIEFLRDGGMAIGAMDIYTMYPEYMTWYYERALQKIFYSGQASIKDLGYSDDIRLSKR